MLKEYPISSSMSVPGAVFAIFKTFASFGRQGVYKDATPEMDNSSWAKFLKNCPNLIDHGISKSDVDIVFTKCKSKNQRKLNFTQFLDALAMLAEIKVSSKAASRYNNIII